MNEELKVIISANIDKLKQGMSEAKGQVGDFEKKSSGMGDKVKAALSKIGDAAKVVGKVVAAGMAAAGTAILAVGKQALEQYGNFEQLKGGIEKLYKGSADAVMDYANKAYATTGMTANEYMETASSFAASLTSALNGNVKAAAETTNMAVNDMADNASVFGTAFEDVQNAYQGFAKQNYTMLDNLKLGYGGTKTEMERLLADAEKLSGVKYDVNNLNDVYSAIHVIQQEMGLTGNAANEASHTIEGSINATKAAYKNLVTGLMDENANISQLTDNLITSAMNVVDSVMPKIEQFATALPQVIEKAAPRLLGAVNGIISSLLPVVVSGATSIMNAAVETLPQITTAIMDNVPVLIDGFLSVADTLVGALPQVIEAIVEALPDLIPQLVDGTISAIMMLVEMLPQIIDPIITALPDIITAVVDALVNNIPALVDGAIQLVLGIVEATGDIVAVLVPMIPEIISKIVVALVKEIPTLITGALKLVGELAKAIADYYASWLNKIGENLAKIGEKFGELKEKLAAKVSEIKDKIVEKFAEIKDKVAEKVENVKTAVTDKFSAIKTAVTEKVESLKTKVSTTFENVKSAITKPFETAKTTVLGVIDKIKNAFKFKWSLPKLNLPHISVTGGQAPFGIGGKGSLPKFSIKWYAKGGVFDKPTMFTYGNGQLGGLGENGAEAVVPLEKNTEWLDKIADKLLQKMDARPVVLNVNGKTFAETTIETLNDYSRQTGGLPLKVF